jgi:antitoxin component YwqK of YwqJK toxin-antitoxin module
LPGIQEWSGTEHKKLQMRSIILLLALCSFSLTSFSQESVNKSDARGMRQGKWVARYPGGSLRYEGYFIDDKPTGEWKRFHENGKLKAQMSYRLLSGRAFSSLFDDEGKLYARGVFDGTNRDSTWNFYSGDIIVQTENYHLGKKEGNSMGFSQHGTVLWAREFRDDLLHGKSIEYYSTGTKKSEITYLLGKKSGPAFFFDENGVLYMEGLYTDDLSEGEWNIYSKEGSINYQIKYSKGNLLNSGAIDSIQLREFKKYDQLKGKIPEPKIDQTDRP